MALRERQLTRHCNRIAIVRSDENSITSPPNERVTVREYVDEPQAYDQTCALLQQHPQVSTDLDLNPSHLDVFLYENGKRDEVKRR